MKRIIAILMAVIVSIGFTSCGKNKGDMGGSEPDKQNIILELITQADVPELDDTEWLFYGGFAGGVELSADKVAAVLAEKCGNYKIIFKKDGTAVMSEGEKNTSGTWSKKSETQTEITFPDESLSYKCYFTGESKVMIASDESGMNAYYFTRQ